MKPTLIIIGLGNRGKEYDHTRHNLGFAAVDKLAGKIKAAAWKELQKFLCLLAEGEFQEKPLLLVKPTTYMNRSGECVRKLVDFYKLDPAKQILVCCDDVDLPLGTGRFRKEGGPGTHNGLKSIVDSIGESFPRYRIGIGPKPEGADLAAWVLSRLTKTEMKTVESALTPLKDVIANQILQ